MKHWAWLVGTIGVVGFITLVAISVMIGRSGKHFVGHGRIVHTFPDGKRLVLLRVNYGKQHQFTSRQKSLLSEVVATQRAASQNDSLCLWLAIYDPRTNRILLEEYKQKSGLRK
ncbi:MAG: hypothetical protein ACK4RG_03260 [Fimbriimonadales bacterium]